METFRTILQWALPIVAQFFILFWGIKALKNTRDSYKTFPPPHQLVALTLLIMEIIPAGAMGIVSLIWWVYVG